MSTALNCSEPGRGERRLFTEGLASNGEIERS